MDIRLHYVEKGEGFPLILLHGNGEDHTYFEHQIAYFSGKYRVIAIDSRGHGQSPRGEAPFSIWQFAEDLYDFMNEKGIKKAYILGFSDGGNIGLCFALLYPEYIEKLIVDGANLYLDGLKKWVREEILESYEKERKRAGYSTEAKKNAELLGLMVNDPNIEPKQLADVNVPVLVMSGTDDMIEEMHTRLICDNLPHAELSWIEGDHFIAAKNPEAFNLAVEMFLANS